MKKKLVILTLSLLTAGMLSGCSLEEILGTTTEVTKTASSETDSVPSKTPSKGTAADTSSKDEKPVTDSTDSSQTASSDENSNQGTEEEIPSQGWNSIVLYDTALNEKQVTRGDDGTGNWYDEDGISYGNLDEIQDESAPIYNENGEEYFWNASFAQEAADAEQGGSGGDSSNDVNDPYDLFSWDEGTNSYIPFQKAEGDGSPIGRGNGWYYYYAESGEYLPW